MTIIVATDGSSLGNPGPTGWAWYVDQNNWACGGYPFGTNNQGELMAVIDFFEQTTNVQEQVHVISDSTYVVKAITEWMPGWKARNWKKADKSPVQNRELLERLDQALQGRDATFEWVKAHAGHDLNEHVDDLARAAATSYSKGAIPAPGPGWNLSN